jgi:hypothetical protein
VSFAQLRKSGSIATNMETPEKEKRPPEGGLHGMKLLVDAR